MRVVKHVRSTLCGRVEGAGGRVCTTNLLPPCRSTTTRQLR